MRHAMRGRKLGRTSAHREALFRNQLQSLVAKERIITTLPKAKELRPIAERVITRGKSDTVPARRWVLRWVLKRDLVKKIFDDISPRMAERPGGYLRIVKLGPRQGDGAEMAVIELVDRVEGGGDGKESAAKKKGRAARKAAASKASARLAGKSARKVAAEAAGAGVDDEREGEEGEERSGGKEKKAAGAKRGAGAKGGGKAAAKAGKDAAKKEGHKDKDHPKASSKKAGKAKPTRQKTG
jgi:large subunit ribosomal protein L17